MLRELDLLVNLVEDLITLNFLLVLALNTLNMTLLSSLRKNFLRLFWEDLIDLNWENLEFNTLWIKLKIFQDFLKTIKQDQYLPLILELQKWPCGPCSVKDPSMSPIGNPSVKDGTKIAKITSKLKPTPQVIFLNNFF